jgi:hypothetical protein
MDCGLAGELTTEERQEHLLLVIACATSHQPARDVAPWIRSRLSAFEEAFGV